MAIDPIASAIQALVTHLATALDGQVADVRAGWPEHEQDFDLEAGAIVTVYSVDAPEERCAPIELARTETDEGAFEVLYKVGELSFPVQVDLWTAYRAVRDDLAGLVEDALQNRAPFGSGLWLTHDDYHDRPVTFEIEGGSRPQGQDGVDRGEWRATWMLRCSSAVVALVTHAKATSIEVETETTGGGRVVTETLLYT